MNNQMKRRLNDIACDTFVEVEELWLPIDRLVGTVIGDHLVAIMQDAIEDTVIYMNGSKDAQEQLIAYIDEAVLAEGVEEALQENGLTQFEMQVIQRAVYKISTVWMDTVLEDMFGEDQMKIWETLGYVPN